MATTTNKVLAWVYDDGGRHQYFKAQKVGDCVTRAIAIASGRDYKEVYDELFAMAGKSPRDGVSKRIIRKYMQAHGYEWVSTMQFGKGVTNHLRENEVPMYGAIVCSCSGHLTAVIDGVVHDTYDPARDGGRAVYGYWIVKPADGEDVVKGDYYKYIDRLPIQWAYEERKHHCKLSLTLKSRVKEDGHPHLWFEDERGVVYYTCGEYDAHTEDECRAQLIEALNFSIWLYHDYNVKGFANYNVSVIYS